MLLPVLLPLCRRVFIMLWDISILHIHATTMLKKEELEERQSVHFCTVAIARAKNLSSVVAIVYLLVVWICEEGFLDEG